MALQQFPQLFGFSAAGSGTGTLSVPWPVNHEPGFVAILIVETGGEGTNLTITTPAGWAAVSGSPVTAVATTAGSKLQVFWKRATSSAEANVTVPDSGDHQLAQMVVFSGCVATGVPWDVTSTGTKTTASTSIAFPALTTTVDNTTALLIATRPNDSGSLLSFGTLTNSVLTNQFSNGREAGTTSGHGGGFVFYLGEKATPGSIGTSTTTVTPSVTNALMVIALRGDIPLSADPGTYNLTGSNAELVRSSFLDAASGSYALTGAAADLVKTSPLFIDAASGAYNLTGSAATLVRSSFLDAASGSYALTGAPADLAKTIIRILDAASGTYSLVGNVAGLARASFLSADSGAYNLTGVAAALFRSISLSTDAGSYSISGQNASLTQAKQVSADPGSYVIDGKDAAFVRVGSLFAAAGAFNVTGSAASLFTTRSLSANAGAYSLTGFPANLFRTSLYPDPGDVREGVVYGPGGIYVGTLRVGGKILFIFDD